MSGILRIENLNKGTTLKQGDKTVLSYRLSDADGEQLNIAGSTAVARLMHPDFTRIGYESEALTVSADNIVQFSIDSIIPSRLYYLEITVDGQYIFPSRSDEGKLSIDRSSMGAEITIIENAGIDAVVRKAVDLINDDPSLIIDEDKLYSEIIANTPVGNIEEYYQQFSDVIKELSKDNDYNSLPEIAVARRGYDTLAESLGNLSVNMINKNLGKLDQTYMTDEFLQQMAGNTPINAIPADDSITTPKYRRNSVTTDKTDFILTGKNLFDKNKVTLNQYWRLMGVGPDFYVELQDTTAVSSVPIFNVEPGATIHKNKEGGFLELTDSLGVVLLHNMSTPAGSFTLSPDTVYLAVNVNNEDIDTYQLEYGESETSYELGYAKLDESISVSKKSIDTNGEKFNLNDFELAKSPMIFDKADNVLGYINRNDGSVRDNNVNLSSNYIKITSPTMIFSENIRGAINIAYYDNDFAYSGLGDQIIEIGTDLVVALKQSDGYFRFSASLETMEDLIVEWGDTITTSSDIYYNYPMGLSLPDSNYVDIPNQPTDGVSLILGTTSATVSLGHVNYILERETIPFTDGGTFQNQDTWRLVGCTVNGESVVTRGAWECAIAIDGLPDFHGTYHGYELMDSINFYVDNKKAESGEHEGQSVRIVYKSKLIKQGTESVEIADVVRMYEFEEGKLALTQRYEWLESLPIANAYVTMLPIIRDGVTHTAYTDYDYVEYDVTITDPKQDINRQKLSIRDAWIYGDGVGVKVSVDYSDPSVPNTFFVSNASEYNKFYYSYSVGREVAIGDNWGVKTVFDIQ